ncbi:MAG TPA: VOC family protein [Candidatus Binataceae bacterium]|nr:VOC family protein [Candidatus Binataceae bacterium]
MPINLNGLGQIALEVRDVDASERFYGDVLGLRKLFRFGTLSFFDMAGLRLLLEQAHGDAPIERGGVLYFRVADIIVARAALETRGLAFTDQIHRIIQMEDHDLWMTFFRDPDGHILALMMEAPKGWRPA